MQPKISKLTLNQETIRTLTDSRKGTQFCISAPPSCHSLPPACPNDSARPPACAQYVPARKGAQG